MPEPQSSALPAARRAELRSAVIKVLAAAAVAAVLFALYSRQVGVEAQVQDLLAGPKLSGGNRSGGARAELNRDTPRGWLAAEDLLHKALDLQSGNSYAIAALADIEVLLANAGFADRQEKAQAAVNRAEGKDVQLPERFEARALQMIAQGQASDAASYLGQQLEKYGAIPRIIDALGRSQRASGKLIDARANFKRAQDADWRSPRAVADYAESLLEDGNPIEAAQAFDRALQDNSDHSRSQVGKARSLIALSLQGRGGADLKAARALCDAVLTKPAAEVPSMLKAYALSTRAEAKLAAGDAISAAQDASDAVAADSKSHFALRARAMTAAAAKSSDAFALLKSAAASDPYDASLYFDGAAALLAAGDGEGAEKLLGSYAAALPRSARFHLALAQSMARRQAYKDAEGELLKAQQLEPANAVIYYEQGRLAQTQKNAKGAKAAYERAAQLRDDFPEVYRQMGELYLENKDVEDALRTFNEALARYKSARTPPQQMEAFYAEVVAGVTRAGKKKLADQWVKEARALH
jgi:tetratricopeptide (TPR) repeat protein